MFLFAAPFPTAPPPGTDAQQQVQWHQQQQMARQHQQQTDASKHRQGVKFQVVGVPQPTTLGPPTGATPVVQRREQPVVFPPGSVETSRPNMVKRQKLMARHVGKIDAWRLVMALKSGLHSEVTWALNILNILLYDDSSVAFFLLSSLPGLLESLVEHLRRTLIDLCPEDQNTWRVLEPSTSRNLEDALLSYVLPEDIDLKPSRDTRSNRMLKVHNSDLPDALVRRLTREYITSQPTEFEENADVGDDNDDVYQRCAKYGAQRTLWAKGGGCPTVHLKLGFDMNVYRSDAIHFSRYDDVLQCNSAKRARLNQAPVASEIEEHERSKWLLYHHEPTDAEKRLIESEEVRWIQPTALCDHDEYQQRLIDKVLAIMNVIRALCLVPFNELTMASHPGLMLLMGRLLTYKHEHVPPRRPMNDNNNISETLFAQDVQQKKRDEQKQIELSTSRERAILKCFDQLREDAFVVLCQLSVVLDLYVHERQVAEPIISGLMHWACCAATDARDMLKPGIHSPQELAFEALCKLSVKDENIDMILSLTPWPLVQRFVEVCGE